MCPPGCKPPGNGIGTAFTNSGVCYRADTPVRPYQTHHRGQIEPTDVLRKSAYTEIASRRVIRCSDWCAARTCRRSLSRIGPLAVPEFLVPGVGLQVGAGLEVVVVELQVEVVGLQVGQA